MFWNFFIYRALWTVNFLHGVSGYPKKLFLVNVTMRSKIFWNFFIYKAVWTLDFSQGGLGTKFFWSDQKKLEFRPLPWKIKSPECSVNKKFTVNLRKKFFWNFFIYRALWTLNFSERMSGQQLFLVMLNLTSKIFWNFLFTEHSGLWIFQREGVGTNFFWSS